MARTRLEKQIRRVSRATDRTARRSEIASGSDVLGGLIPEAEDRAAARAEDLRSRAVTTNNVKKAVRLNSRAGEIEGALDSGNYTGPGGSPRVAALRELARLTRLSTRTAGAPARATAVNTRRGELISDAVRGRVSNRSGTGLGLNLNPSRRADLRIAANSGTLQNFLDTLRAGQLRRFNSLTGMEGTRGTIARGFLAADENARRANPNAGRNTAVSYGQPVIDPLATPGYAAPVPPRSTVFPAP